METDEELERALLVAQIIAQAAAIAYILWLMADDDWLDRMVAGVLGWWPRTVLAQRLRLDREWRRQIGRVVMEAMEIVEGT